LTEPTPSLPLTRPLYRLRLVLAVRETIGQVKLWHAPLTDLVRCMTADPRLQLYADPDPELPAERLAQVWTTSPLVVLRPFQAQPPTIERETVDGKTRWCVGHYGLLARATEPGTDPVALVLAQLAAFGFLQVQELDSVIVPEAAAPESPAAPTP
jgi:hypothetical protein